MGQQIRAKQILFDSQIDFTSLLKITNLANGTAANDAVNLSQLQAVAAGYDPKAAVRVASAATITLTTDYTRTGTGATHLLTAAVNGALSLDGVSTGWIDIDNDGATNDHNDPTQATRVLIKDASDAKDNGIYVVQDKGSAGTPWKLLRASDQNGDPTTEVSTGNTTFVTEGTANGATAWVVLNDGATTGELTLETNNINWTQVGASTTYTAGNGIDSTALAGGAITVDLDGTSNGTSGLGLAAGGISISSNIAGLGLALNSGVLSINLSEFTSAAVDVATDEFVFIDATDGSMKKESFNDYAGFIAGNGLSSLSGTLAVDITEFTTDTSISATDVFAMNDGNMKKVPFSLIESSLSLENIQAGTAAGQLMIWNNTGGVWANATLAVGTADRAGLNVVNADGAITVGVDIENMTSIGAALDEADKFIVYDVSADANLSLDAGDLATWIATQISFDNYVSWTLSDGSNTQAITSSNTMTLAHGNGLQIVVGATDTATFTIVPDTTGGANLASAINLSANGIAISVDDTTIEEGNNNQLRVKANGISANELNVSGNGTAGQILTSDGDGSFSWAADNSGTTPVRLRYTSSVVSSGVGVAVADVFGANDPADNTIPAVYVNGILVHVEEDETAGGDCWFTEGISPSSGAAVAFADLSGNEDLVWSVTNAGYGLDANDKIEIRFEV